MVPRARLAQSVEHQTFNLRVKGSSPLLGASFFFLCLQRQGTHLGFVNFFSFWASTSATFLWIPWQQRGAVEACWAHNPEVDGSKPSAATLFFFFSFFLFKDFCAHSIPYCHVPLIAQLVERRTVVGCAEILRSLVRIRLEGQLFFFSRPFFPIL